LLVQHFQANAVALAQIGRRHLAGVEHLQDAPLGDAARAARRIVARNRAAANDRAGGECARLGSVGNQAIEPMNHLARVGIAEHFAVDLRAQPRVQAEVTPRAAQLVRRNRDGGKSARGFRLNEAESLRELRPDQIAQRHVVADHHQHNACSSLRRRCTVRHGGRDHRNFTLVIDAPLLRSGRNEIGRRQKGVGCTLVHPGFLIVERVDGPVDPFGHAQHVSLVHAAVAPLVSPRQRRMRAADVEGLAASAVIEPPITVLELRRQPRPSIERRLQGGSDVAGARHAFEIARNHDQFAVGFLRA